MATVKNDVAVNLQGHTSEVQLQIKKECPRRAYLMAVRTDLSNFESIIPDDECFISPIVEVLAPAKTVSSSYVLRIPHCLDEDDDKNKVKVRMIPENEFLPVILVPERAKCTDGVLFYDIGARFIELHTPHFTTVACSICQSPYHCRERINNMWLAKYETEEKKASSVQKIRNILTGFFHKKESPVQHQVEIRPYFGGVLYDIVDFRKVE